MSNDDIARRKFDMLMQAVEQAGQQDAAMDELRHAAFEVLLHPGCELEDWGELLAERERIIEEKERTIKILMER